MAPTLPRAFEPIMQLRAPFLREAEKKRDGKLVTTKMLAEYKIIWNFLDRARSQNIWDVEKRRLTKLARFINFPRRENLQFFFCSKTISKRQKVLI